ncbi:unnamed protein product [Cercopithifilaria johnstoni]|uniref:Uncharacterized protein n=1 Tax=Cercopithifilaria johnstoni TaxID=2874296 RepID=A0A8J2LX68_9BILA|nr:unnamed protein product [Cercopithifilaria johnstoni]
MPKIPEQNRVVDQIKKTSGIDWNAIKDLIVEFNSEAKLDAGIIFMNDDDEDDESDDKCHDIEKNDMKIPLI